jgi:hypothetical protein
MPEIVHVCQPVLVFRTASSKIARVDSRTKTYADVSAAIGRYLN